MPLILVTGLPSSGKSETSQKICNFLKEKLKQDGDTRLVKVVSDEDNLEWEGRDEVYTSIAKEKELRGWLRSEAQRYINLNQIVILDAAVYIKGFRYELYCLTKEAKTQYCIVERLLDSATCWSWNKKLRDQVKQEPNDDGPVSGYSKGTFDALVMRYEKCDESNRWDSPLFRITSTDDQLNLEQLYEAVTKKEPLQPNKCTSLTSTTNTIYKTTTN